MSILTDEEIKQQTRELRKLCFGESDDFLDIYFEEKYAPGSNLTRRHDARLTAACQLLPYRFTFFGSVLHAGFVSGLAVAPAFQRQGLAAGLLREAHRRLYEQGGTLSFLLPPSAGLRHFFEGEGHGAYWTATFRRDVELRPSAPADPAVRVDCPEEWGRELYVSFRKATRESPFMLHPGEGDFFAALASCDLDGGWVLVARRGQRVSGVMLAVPSSDGRVFVRDLQADGLPSRDALVRFAMQRAGVECLHAKAWCTGATQGAGPYAMARVVNVMRFLRAVVEAYPGFQLHIGVDHDFDVPENNGYYRVAGGRVELVDERPDSIVTPGGLAAMLLGAYPVELPMMLNE